MALFSVCTYFLVAQPVVATSARMTVGAAAQRGALMIILRFWCETAPVCQGRRVLSFADTNTSLTFYVQMPDQVGGSQVGGSPPTSGQERSPGRSPSRGAGRGPGWDGPSAGPPTPPGGSGNGPRGSCCRRSVRPHRRR